MQYDTVRNAKTRNTTLFYGKRLEYTIICIQLWWSYWNRKVMTKVHEISKYTAQCKSLQLLWELTTLKATTSLNIKLALNLNAELVATWILRLWQLEYWIGLWSSVFLLHLHGTVPGSKWSNAVPGALLIPSSTLTAWSVSAWSGGCIGVLRVWWGTEVPRLLAAE